jgi:Holliday junction resolvasome RuvABC endonuclease subunit
MTGCRSEMRIMGIDPSLSGCGLVLIIDGQLKVAQTVSTKAKDVKGQRLEQLSEEVAKFLIHFKPDFVAMEDYSYGSPYNRESMGEVGGIIKYTLWAAGIEPMLWPNQSWKKVLFGKGNLKKEDLKLPVFQKFRVELDDMNQVEAFCVARAEFEAQANPTLRPVPKKKKGAKK